MSYLQGQIKIQEIKTRNVGIPTLLVNAIVKFEFPTRYMTDAKILQRKAVLQFNGDTISQDTSFSYTEHVSEREITYTFHFQLSSEILKIIETNRVDDISIHLYIHYLYQFFSEQDKNNLIFETSNLSLQIPLSQKKWTDILKELGYMGTWIIELKRIDIEGMERVNEHIAKAGDALSKNNFEGCISEVRAALKSFQPLFSGIWESVAIYIDEGSRGEPDRDPVSVRVKSLYSSIRDLVNAGMHKEAYLISPEEVRLCYYQTVTLLSYLSKVMGNCDR